ALEWQRQAFVAKGKVAELEGRLEQLRRDVDRRIEAKMTRLREELEQERGVSDTLRGELRSVRAFRNERDKYANQTEQALQRVTDITLLMDKQSDQQAADLAGI
ncbi:hypothetical protein KIPB_014032, partial [Kipferlia bialata]